MQKQLKDFTEVELKALAYDNVAQLEQAQNNLKVINNELARRKQPEVTGEVTGTEVPEETTEVTGTTLENN
jgi:hypothetical protein